MIMEHLPHGGYAHVATKDDLRVLSVELRKEIADSARRQTIAMVGIMAALMSAQTALIVAFVR